MKSLSYELRRFKSVLYKWSLTINLIQKFKQISVITNFEDQRSSKIIESEIVNEGNWENCFMVCGVSENIIKINEIAVDQKLGKLNQ